MTARWILLVEDDPDEVLLARMALAQVRTDLRLEVAEDAPEALVRLGLEPAAAAPLPDLVLLDLKLQTSSGFEVLERVRRQLPARDLPVVVLTSSDQPSDIHRAYLLGANAFVQKPVALQEFTRTLAGICRFWLREPAAPGSRP